MEKDNIMNLIDSEELINSFRLTNNDNLPFYFKSIWKDLTRRSDNPEKGVNKIDFSNYYELPGIISTGLFRYIDKDKDDYLNYKEFSEAMLTLFTKGTKDLIKFVFEFLDDDDDKFISQVNVKSIFQYIPLQNKNFSNSSFKDRYESQEELHNIVSNFFKTKEKIDCKEFEELTINENSTIFLYIIVFLLSKKPFNESTIGFYDVKSDLDSENKKTIKYSDKTLIASPNLLSKFSPGNKILNSPIMSKEKEKLKKIYNDNAKEGKLMYTKSTELFTIKDKENMYRTDFSEESNSKVDLLNPSRQENIKFLNGIISMEVTEELLESLKIEPEVEITHEGYLVKVVEDKLKKLWFVLYDKYLYCKKYFNYIDYKHKTDTTHKGMHSLTDAYIKEHGKVNILKNTLYRFEIYFNQKVKEYYCINEEDYIMWIKMLKKVTGSFNLFEKYEIVDKLTSGKFGIIRLLSNKETKENVVLKMINKKKLNSVELLEVKTEVEIMKICQHKNIVRLLDINEDDENKYLGKIFKFK